MKIFNWVHRRFNNKLAENAGSKNGVIAQDEQLQLVVENNTSVFERWRGGILTIGTFGYDPLKDENEENDVCFHNQEESDKEHLLSEDYESDLITADSDEEEEVEINEEGEEEEEEEEESNSLVYAAAYTHEFERLMEEKKRVVVESESEFEFDFEFEYVMLEKTTEKARTTLADLFSADTEELQKKNQQQQEDPMNKLGETAKEKANNYCKQQGCSFGKKLIVDEARPIHKLHQLMRRMLKRKIHPDEHASLLP